MLSDKEIIDNISGEEKLRIWCKLNEVSQSAMINNIYYDIKDSYLEDKQEYIDTYTQSSTDGWSCGEEFGGYILYLDKYLLMTREEMEKECMEEVGEIDEDWIAETYIILDDKEREFVKIALECGVNEFYL